MVAANKEATEPRVPFGKVEVKTSKILGDLRCSGRISSSTSGTHRVNLVTNQVISRE
jgi:hypothetical protein